MKKEEKEEERKRSGNQPLRTKQLSLLYLAFSFRFLTADLVSQYMQQSSNRSARARLVELWGRGYLGRRHDGSYKLSGRPAEYYPTPLSAGPLRATFQRISEAELHLLYARPKASSRLVARSLTLLEIRNQMTRIYGDRLEFIPKPLLNISDFSYLPHPLPDAYLAVDAGTKNEQTFFCDYLDDAVSIGIHARKLRHYMDYRESDEWDEAELAFPAILLVCQSPSLLKQTRRRVRFLENQHDSGIQFQLIDLPSLRTATTPASVARLHYI